MKKIRIMFDFTQGPIWKEKLDIKTGQWSTGIPIIDNDAVLNSLNDKASRLYESLYSFDAPDGCSFDIKRYKESSQNLLDMISKIKDRLNFLNDGSYQVVDEESEKLRLIQ